MKQKIEIGLTTSSCDESFRILKVLLMSPSTPDNWTLGAPTLIVISKRSDPMGMGGYASCGNFTASVEVDVDSDNELPVRHYVIGLGKPYPSMTCGFYNVEEPASAYKYDFLPNVPYRHLTSLEDMPSDKEGDLTVQVLYENEFTEEKEEELRAKCWAEEYEIMRQDAIEIERLLREEENEDEDGLPVYVKALAFIAVTAFSIAFFKY